VYNMASFGTDNFWYDRIMEYGDFYNKGVWSNTGQEYVINPFHILWPVSERSISANSLGIMNQNYGYTGFENNVPALTSIPPEDDN